LHSSEAKHYAFQAGIGYDEGEEILAISNTGLALMLTVSGYEL
jgi:hypothetical protein